MSAIDTNSVMAVQSLESEKSSLFNNLISSRMHSDFCRVEENMQSCSHINTRHLETELVKKNIKEDITRVQKANKNQGRSVS